MSDRIDEYHGADAKVLTTADVESLPEHGDEDGGMPGVVLVDREDLLATTLEIERAQTALDEVRAEVARRDALISGDGYEDMRRHAADLAQRLETAERERDEARSSLGALADVAGAAQGLRYVDFAAGEEVVVSDEIRGNALWGAMRETIRERDAARATIVELVTALEGLFVEYDHLRNAGSKHALTYWVDHLPDHACAECVPGGPIVDPGFRCREHAARAALAKAKEATNG